MVLNEHIEAVPGVKLSDIYKVKLVQRSFEIRPRELFQHIFVHTEYVFEYDFVDREIQHNDLILRLNDLLLTDDLMDSIYTAVSPSYRDQYISIQRLYPPNKEHIAFLIGLHGPQDIREPFELIIELIPKEQN